MVLLTLHFLLQFSPLECNNWVVSAFVLTITDDSQDDVWHCVPEKLALRKPERLKKQAKCAGREEKQSLGTGVNWMPFDCLGEGVLRGKKGQRVCAVYDFYFIMSKEGSIASKSFCKGVRGQVRPETAGLIPTRERSTYMQMSSLNYRDSWNCTADMTEVTPNDNIRLQTLPQSPQLPVAITGMWVCAAEQTLLVHEALCMPPAYLSPSTFQHATGVSWTVSIWTLR